MSGTAVGGSPTSPQQLRSNGLHAGYVPHDLRYDADFEDDLIRAVLEHDDRDFEGIRVLPDDSREQPVEGVSLRAKDIPARSLPTIAEDELPLPLSDARRIYMSSLPGVKLTHPGGYIEGGPGLEPDMDTFPEDFLAHRPHVTTSEQLRQAVREEVQASIQLLKSRLRARQEAKDRNEQIERELKTLTDQHSMELKIHNRMQEEMTKKKEAKEKRRKDKERTG